MEIIRAVLYFDVFKYPLTKDELFENSAISISKDAFAKELDSLVKNGLLKQEDNFILTNERNEQDITRRMKGNNGAKDIMPLANEYSKKIAAFPFVQAVLLSGSISKNYFDEKSDVDYFIITKPNRLWICRTLLIIRYKLLPKSLKKYWCTNYFISSDTLSIPDKNVFTATELAYLIPITNYSLYQKLLVQNIWYKDRFPNKEQADQKNCLEVPGSTFKTITETLLNGMLGYWLDNRLLNITLKRWRKKYPDMNKEDFDLQFRSRKDVCKRHTHGFQNRVLIAWQDKKKEFETQFGVSLNPVNA